MAWFSRIFASHNAQQEVILSPEQQEVIKAWQQLPAVDLDCSHMHSRYVIVDIEASGLDTDKDHLISIGAMALVDGKIDFKDAFQVVLRQDQVSSNENILIHGIGGLTQSAGMDPVEALLAFLRYIGKSPLVAYHAFFDQSMIEKAMGDYLGMELGQTWIDLAWVLPGLFDFQIGTRVELDDWLELFGIDNFLRHNAVSDAYATARLLQVVIAAAIQQGADSPGSFLKMEKARRRLYESL
ncbi:MAG: 3'-5' exonuclease [Propionivibrio sp.]|uniref:3'-5' exonuclease n=1 Tax=Propionivibrio sp. TaxID=2212460 RepID=UPI001A4085E4|nr:3'-5' exonuclease [Propionivibrio sp.]MBL8414180.1 3'-5' exonuclease [Propionivibrio sp.]